MNLSLTPDHLAICRLPPDAAIPDWAARAAGFVSLTRTTAELSIVCAAPLVPPSVKQEPGWRAFQVAGPLDFALTGVLAALATPLAQAGISLFALSTYDTDYVLVRADRVPAAAAALRAAGHTVRVD